MKLGATILAFAFALMAMAATAAVQQEPQGPPSNQQSQTLPALNANLVNVLFTVTDTKKGTLVAGLTKDDFKVFEDGVPQTITAFSNETDPPLTIAVLIDASGSIRDKMKFEQAAAADFFQYTLIRKKDRGTVISFDSGVDLMTPEFTDNPSELREALSKVKVGGGTSMFDAIFLAVKGDAKWPGLSGQSGRRVVVVISDGDDNFSHVDLTDTLRVVQANDVRVYAISTNSNFFLGAATPNAKGEKNLRKLTEETGGQTFLPETEKELFLSFDRIRQDLRTLYSIDYTPLNMKTDGAFRKIRVDFAAKNKDYRIRHRLGYNAPGPQPSTDTPNSKK